MMEGADSCATERLGELLSRATGQTLSEGRRWRIETSLRPLLRLRGIASLDALLLALERDPAGSLMAETIDAMLNHESSFFRDVAVFRTIESLVLPQIMDRAQERTLRIWCAGCSTGQEAYSLAMMIKRMEALNGWRVSIQASDVSEVAIATARTGRYSQMDMQRGLPISELLRWFHAVGTDWQIADEIRDMISFHADNILEPRRISGTFDLVLCRNVLLYFSDEMRRKACDQIARRARAGTFLVLGASEMLAGGNSAFTSHKELGCVYVANRPTRLAAVTDRATSQGVLPPSAPLG